ncbi:hypothetical protein BJV74DRAFT_62812 [Russula compacta]|nr:hypothetical protein BJV74DRAFT_62812 [Russula compacta]
MFQLCSHLPVPVSAYFSTLLASSVIAYSLPPPILGTNPFWPFMPLRPGSYPSITSTSLMSYLSLFSLCDLVARPL